MKTKTDLRTLLDEALGTQPKSGRARIAVGIDISGSMPGNIRKTFAAKVASISRTADAEIHLLAFDDKVRFEQKLDGADLAAAVDDITPTQGGTSFIDVVNRAAALDPSVIVILTDLKGPSGNSPGRTPVIWVSPDDDTPDPPFGCVVQLGL